MTNPIVSMYRNIQQGVNKSQMHIDAMRSSKKDLTDYMKMVLNPFSANTVRGASKFF